MSMDIQYFILKGFFENLNYFRKVSINCEIEYFDEDKGIIIQFIKNYFSKYEKIPEYSVVINSISSQTQINKDLRNEIEKTIETVKKLEFDSIKEGSWLFDKTKDFINNRAMFLVLKEGAIEVGKEDGNRNYETIEKKMREALSMDWNEELGLDYFDEVEFDRIYDELSNTATRIPLGIKVLDDALNGGIPGKTKFCAIFVGQAGIGKSFLLSNVAIAAVKSGKNVLYVTFEIDQKELRKRIDSSFTDLSINNILQLRDEVKKRILEIKQHENAGRFIIKEYPPASVSAVQIEHFLHTLSLKKQFKPDIIILDYLGIMLPVSPKSCNGLYEKGKTVCEEIRALSDRVKCPVLSACQANRAGFGQLNVEMENIADSMGIAHTADLIISLSQTDELKENNQMKFEVIKSRISKGDYKGIINIDYDKLKVIDQEEKTKNDMTESIVNGIKEIEKIKKKNIEGIT